MTFFEHTWDKVYNDENSLRLPDLQFTAKLTYVILASTLFKKNPSQSKLLHLFKDHFRKKIPRQEVTFLVSVCLFSKVESLRADKVFFMCSPRQPPQRPFHLCPRQKYPPSLSLPGSIICWFRFGCVFFK